MIYRAFFPINILERLLQWSPERVYKMWPLSLEWHFIYGFILSSVSYTAVCKDWLQKKPHFPFKGRRFFPFLAWVWPSFQLIEENMQQQCNRTWEVTVQTHEGSWNVAVNLPDQMTPIHLMCLSKASFTLYTDCFQAQDNGTWSWQLEIYYWH